MESDLVNVITVVINAIFVVVNFIKGVKNK